MIEVIADEGSDKRLFTVGNVDQLSEMNVGVEILNLEHPGGGQEPHYLYRRPHPHDNGILTENARVFSNAGVVETADGFCVVQNVGRNDIHSIWKCKGVSSAGFAAVVDPKTGREHFLPPWKPSTARERTYEILGEAPRVVRAQGLWLSAGGPQGYVDLDGSEVDLAPAFIDKGGKIWEALEQASREASGQDC